ncbi:MAG: DnaJ domain-containing protein [Fluviicola sp.]
MAGFFFMICILLAIGFQALVNRNNDKEWYRGLFESNDHYQNDDGRPIDRLLEAYISLGALMVRKDTASYGEKVLYLNNYFSKNFPRTHYNFGRSFTESLKNPIRPKALTKYLRRRLPQRRHRMQIMYFLAGLATVDGSMNKREIELLQEVNSILELSPKDFDSIIAMYTQKQSRKESTLDAMPKLTAVQLACKILGVSEHASKEEIKKAYRDLVKLHHPDRFATQPEEHQELAEERFIEIQKAYEVLERYG